ncbi:uncharacterized protein LOC119591865 [Penaeus monodon]|uniref:uncharacterized protein LOC119591865 n=1 Tax=Penaeus monodon TaxID=6687 RepID=UPI0018A782D8|nr:uncharacterized protein LOC119591865 [Penaeus monodon]XP_037796541.1 uncharacterized protein LOC119591865 [Penaeus monodon]XP_037796548.1 uncharacterized protein LOC119591865 [Penaeus monodon]
MAEAADRYRSAHLYRGKALKFPQPKPFSQTRDKGTIDEIVCHACGKNGHIKPNCPDNPRNFRGVKIPNQSCPDDPSPATTDVATLTSCASPDLCEPPEEPDLCDLPNLPSSCDQTDFPDKPTFPFSTESTQPFCCACDTWGPKTKNCSVYALPPLHNQAVLQVLMPSM